MNERIKELAEQATTKISFRLDPTTYKHIDDPEGEFERVEFDKQKFAELIVKECAAVANYRSDGHEVNQFGSKKFLYFTDIGQEILEYFGVEE